MLSHDCCANNCSVVRPVNFKKVMFSTGGTLLPDVAYGLEYPMICYGFRMS